MKLNDKGFSLVELLAVISILGILFGIAVQAYSRYIENTRNQGYDILAESSINAFEEYLMDHPFADEVSIEVLHNDKYLDNISDPGNKGGTCDGLVKITSTEEESGKLKKNSYELELCCANKYFSYDSDGGKVKKDACGIE